MSYRMRENSERYLRLYQVIVRSHTLYDPHAIGNTRFPHRWLLGLRIPSYLRSTQCHLL